jgi:hypothetical protein
LGFKLRRVPERVVINGLSWRITITFSGCRGVKAGMLMVRYLIKAKSDVDLMDKTLMIFLINGTFEFGDLDEYKYCL